jgi:Protein of unknown function (DUF3224)
VSGDTASFVGIERVSGSIASRTGTFVLQDQGTLKGNRVTGRWSVVSGSGTGDLAGLRGDGGFTANLGQGADITLDYWFEQGGALWSGRRLTTELVIAKLRLVSSH